MRFLVDENLPAGIAALLAAGGHEILDVARSVHRGADDATLWRLAQDEARVVVTRDLDFPLPRRLGRPAGLVVLRAGAHLRARDLENMFAAFAAAIDWPSLDGTVTIVEPGRVRQRPLASLPER